MSTITLHYFDICRQQINPLNDQGQTCFGHLKHRIYTPDGQQGEKIELCDQHAEEVYRFIKELR